MLSFRHRRDNTTGIDEGSSSRWHSSLTETFKRPRDKILSAVARRSRSHKTTGLDPPLCSWCDGIHNRKRDQTSWVDLSEAILREVRDNAESSQCISCILIFNALPLNAFSEATDQDVSRPGTLMRLLPIVLCIMKTKIAVRHEDTDQEFGALITDLDGSEHSPIISECIDFTLPKAWLEHCGQIHGVACSQQGLSIRHRTPIDIILVDVVRACITMMTTAERYFALSYVWGDAVSITTTMDNLAKFQQPGSLKNELTLPNTIADAIVLTREMGVRYLWVDCLSIVQNSPKKHRDISNMDIIFAQAELTIVAQGGRNADSGLAGVHKGTRKQTRTFTSQGNVRLKLALPCDKFNLLEGTICGSRGWTFQEILLSKRVLFVTEHQLVFHCDTSRCSESHPDEESHISHDYGDGGIGIALRETSRRSESQIVGSYSAMIKAYTKKRLKFENDIENAFAGLSAILSVWCDGTPVLHGMLLDFFSYSLSWNFRESHYPRKGISNRRSGYPSWSWVGWTASVSNLTISAAVTRPLRSFMRNVEIRTCGLHNTKSESLVVFDRSAKENGEKSKGLRIRVELEPAMYYSKLTSHSTLSFDAERTDWNNFTVKDNSRGYPIFVFGVPGQSSEYGLLSIVPRESIIRDVFDQATYKVDCSMSLVRLYHLQLNSRTIENDLDMLLFVIENSGDHQERFEKEFRNRLARSDLLYIMLIRRHGQYSERIGSGVMFEEYWPSTTANRKNRAYQEKIVLV